MKLVYLLFFAFNIASAQEFNADLSYKYMNANKWDNAIQTYNFSRPFLEEKQPLLIHGINTSISYIFKSPKTIQHGINISYSYFKSAAENENLNNILNLHFINLGYIIHYENNEKTKGLYTELIMSTLSSGLFRKINGEPFEYKENSSNAFGIGGDIGLKIGYHLKSKNNMYLSPFMMIAYTPFLYSPFSEELLNQTNGLTSEKWAGILTTQIGLTFHVRK